MQPAPEAIRAAIGAKQQRCRGAIEKTRVRTTAGVTGQLVGEAAIHPVRSQLTMSG